jgi:hypothetical protein
VGYNGLRQTKFILFVRNLARRWNPFFTDNTSVFWWEGIVASNNNSCCILHLRKSTHDLFTTYWVKKFESIQFSFTFADWNTQRLALESNFCSFTTAIECDSHVSMGKSVIHSEYFSHFLLVAFVLFFCCFFFKNNKNLVHNNILLCKQVFCLCKHT